MILSIVLAASVCLSQTTGDGPLAETKEKIESLVASSGAELVGLAVYDVQTGQSLFINERAVVHAASTMKVPVMMEVFRLAQLKKLDLRAPIEIKNKFSSIIDGSEYSLSGGDDSDDEVYKHIGKTMTVLQLLDHMITRSSNLATNLLIEKVKAENVARLMRELGANDIQVRRGVEDTKAFQAGINNTTTAYDLMLLLKLLAEPGRQGFFDQKSREQMVAILAAQQFNDGIPAGLPRGTRVAHKTGEITKHNHDAGIVYLPGRKPYVVVVLTKGISEKERSTKLIADISGVIFEALRGENAKHAK